MKPSNFNWIPGLFILGYHLMLLIALPLYFMHQLPSWKLVVISAALVYITGIAVTAGYHRLYSHTTYKINRFIEPIMLYFATMATQGSVLRWAFDHRHHHAFVDTDRDPYSIKKGFWYAHFLWLLEKPKEIENKVIADLARRPLLRFQHRFYGVLMVTTNIVTTLFIGWWLGDYLGAFLFAWFVRLFFLHHFTWFINSLAHTWGARTFCQELSAVDNYLISLVTFGEGYHNYHHTFAYDYRNGIRWYHFDPTKWLIWTLSKLGLAHNLKKNQHYFIQEKLILERKQLFLEKLRSSLVEYKEGWEEKITKLSESLLEKIKQVKQLKELHKGLKKEEKKDALRELKLQMKAIKKGLKEDGREWMALYRNLMEQSEKTTV
ncbi:MAG TPA: fatty acid desaturase [Rhabdochlamydiaceae bacterium]|nr:fatty acid desaturase [Rhabdochlamydiaceae bacterium]